MADPLLNLTTITEYPTVQIDGEKHALLPPDALSVTDYHRFNQMSPRLAKLWSQSTLNDAESEELKGLFKSIAALVLQAPADVLERLTDIQRLQVYQAFTKLPSASLRAMAVEAPETTAKPTGAKSRRGLPGSTAAVRTTGLNGRRSGTSGRVS